MPRIRTRPCLEGPRDREAAVRILTGEARRRGLESAGIASYEDGLLAVGNSRGVRAARQIVSGRVSATFMRGEDSGWADRSGPDIMPGHVRALARRAADTCVRSARPRTLSPGAYTVILEPACVGDLLQFAAWYGFGAQAYQEGQSFLNGLLGRRVFSPHVSIEDNAYHPLALGLPFDFEGLPRRRVALIERGVARGMVHDRRTARRARVRSTGHGLPEPNDMGPIPLNLVMRPGSHTVEEMIASTERGIWVTHFHYTNVMDPKRLILTGLTRDGTFLIEKGRVRGPIRNLRFTESLVNALARVEAVGREAVYTEGFFGGGFVVPAVKIKDFRFTSLAETK